MYFLNRTDMSRNFSKRRTPPVDFLSNQSFHRVIYLLHSIGNSGMVPSQMYASSARCDLQSCTSNPICLVVNYKFDTSELEDVSAIQNLMFLMNFMYTHFH